MRVAIEGTRHHKCDWCRRDFTEEDLDHITIEVGPRSGRSSLTANIAVPGWRFTEVLVAKYLDFCSANCISQFFKNCWVLPEYVRK